MFLTLRLVLSALTHWLAMFWALGPMVGNVLPANHCGWRWLGPYSLWLAMAWTLFTVVGKWQCFGFAADKLQLGEHCSPYQLISLATCLHHTCNFHLTKNFAKRNDLLKEIFFAYTGGWNLMKFSVTKHVRYCKYTILWLAWKYLLIKCWFTHCN